MNETKTIAILGAGTMGNGIAHVCARSGFSVLLYDIDQHSLYRGLDTIRKNIAREVAKQKLTQEQADEARSRITLTTSLKDLAPASLAIEAATERFESRPQSSATSTASCPPKRFSRPTPVPSRSRRSPPRPDAPNRSSACTSSTLCR